MHDSKDDAYDDRQVHVDKADDDDDDGDDDARLLSVALKMGSSVFSAKF